MLVAQSCLTLRAMDCSLPTSSVHGTLQARILEWVAFCRGSSWPRDRSQVSYIAGRFFTTEPPGKSETQNLFPLYSQDLLVSHVLPLLIVEQNLWPAARPPPWVYGSEGSYPVSSSSV